MRVVIVGGGFAGVRAALDLANQPNFEVVLISKQTYFEYHAALYRSATGRSPLEVSIPLADFFTKEKNIEVVKDEITEINSKENSVVGSSQSVYRYDALIMAVGAVTQYFNIKGLAKYSYGVKSIQEALELKRRLHEDLTATNHAERNYVVVGGGPTGIELAGELVSYLHLVRRKHGVRAKFNVDLIEAGSSLLPSMPKSYSKKITARLNRLGVDVHLNTAVDSQSVDEIEFPRGHINSHTVIWTAGIANNPIFATYPDIFHTTKGGKVEVNQYLQTQSDIYVLGDSAATTYSGMAQTAIHDANFVTNNLIRGANHKSKIPYQPQKPIYAIPVGPNWSAVLWSKVSVYGFAGWVLRRLADLKLYHTFLPLHKALYVWRGGFVIDESCPICK